MEVILKKHFWVVNLVVIAICGVFAGRAAAHFLEGAYLGGEDTRGYVPPRPFTQPTKVHGKDPDEMIKRDVFCSGCLPPPPQTVQQGTPADANNTDVKSSLQLELVSTMVCPSDENWSMAVIRDLSTKEKDPAMYNRGAKVGTTSAVVERVLARRVYLRNQGRREYIELDTQQPPQVAANVPPPASPYGGPFDPNLGDVDKGVTCSGNSCTVERQLVEKMLSNTALLASAARFVPSIKDNKPNGFKLYAIRPNSIFGKIGLQNGDTVRAINGMDMSTPDKALEVYTKVRFASHLSVAVERRGENMTLDYSIR